VKSETFQRDVFRDREGDNYFVRNEKTLLGTSPVKSLVIERIAHHIAPSQGTRVLEVGCASGGNLAALNNLRTIEGFGIDPSSDAVRAGQESFPNFDLHVGTADSLPFDDGCMDVVWFGFCLYLVDRALLYRVIAEADRVLTEGGFIAIHDFDPDVACVRPYSHYAGLNSYKMNYSAMFLCNPAYALVEKLSFSHYDTQWTNDAQQRLGLWICRKNLQLGYRLE
jgi:ubiquinone/menaquinone biosynthesis C-methylase UbiE